jgi:hypothetical protein
MARSVEVPIGNAVFNLVQMGSVDDKFRKVPRERRRKIIHV